MRLYSIFYLVEPLVAVAQAGLKNYNLLRMPEMSRLIRRLNYLPTFLVNVFVELSHSVSAGESPLMPFPLFAAKTRTQGDPFGQQRRLEASTKLLRFL